MLEELSRSGSIYGGPFSLQAAKVLHLPIHPLPPLHSGRMRCSSSITLLLLWPKRDHQDQAWGREVRGRLQNKGVHCTCDLRPGRHGRVTRGNSRVQSPILEGDSTFFPCDCVGFLRVLQFAPKVQNRTGCRSHRSVIAAEIPVLVGCALEAGSEPRRGS
ncbi:uncharacterized protein LOC134353227 isoform X1 [Mobula hypostoma]|uniref:uncharacterized protein LOC134353227 isoform X1 n=1 Tax=Mobula hypostoma TaxID=723540 RepID=UPI002FC28147